MAAVMVAAADDDPVAPFVLGQIERQIGSLGQFLDRVTMLRIGRQADRGSEMQIDTVELEMNFADHLPPLLGPQAGDFKRHARHQDDELLATETTQHVFVTDTGL